MFHDLYAEMKPLSTKTFYFVQHLFQKLFYPEIRSTHLKFNPVLIVAYVSLIWVNVRIADSHHQIFQEINCYFIINKQTFNNIHHFKWYENEEDSVIVVYLTEKPVKRFRVKVKDPSAKSTTKNTKNRNKKDFECLV